MTRRELLLLPGAGLMLASEPQNLSYPLKEIEGKITPQKFFFVRDHFRTPEVSLQSWKLRIEGRVERPYELNFADLVELPTRRVEAVLECAGNAAGGSAASNGVWEGVPISTLLEAARPSQDATSVMFEGMDSGRLFEDRPPLPFSQMVPLEKCLEPSSLVAFKLNDLALPKRNGFPARALFPGWYGMDSVKWLRRMVVLRAGERDTAFEQSEMGRVYNRSGSGTRLSSLQVKSAVAWPGDGLKLPAGRYTVWGFAWSGTGSIQQVAVTIDGGQNWRAARLEPQAEPYAWARWSYGWNATAGEHILMSRATDGSGNEQPLKRDLLRKDAYELNWCVPLRCSVR